MKWKEKIQMWLKGEYQKYPSSIKKSFYYETTPITIKMDTTYQDTYIEDSYLSNMIQDFTPFINQINKSKEKYVFSFYNLSKSAYLIIPIPRKDKIFTTLKDFMDNASKTQQKEFWKQVAKSTIGMLQKHKKVWISTHGTGVPYLHVRIDIKPKYYITEKFKTI